jgi:hypothetical protein
LCMWDRLELVQPSKLIRTRIEIKVSW